MTTRFLKKTLTMATAAFTLAACGGGESLGPAIELTEAQTEDMMEALSAISSVGTEFRVVSASFRSNTAAAASGVALLVIPIDETEECPTAGTTRVKGSMNFDEEDFTGSANVTQSFNNCQSPSESGTVWTFNNSLQMTMTFGETSANGTLKGTLKVASSAGEGSCPIDVTYTETSSSYTTSGTVCGQSFSETIDF